MYFKRNPLAVSVGADEGIQMALADVAFDVPLCGIVADQGKPLVLGDLHQTQEPRYEIAKSTGIAAYAGFPICARDKVIGVISFGSTETTAFDQEALSFFQTIARFLSISRERADDAETLRISERRARLAQAAGGIGTFEVDIASGQLVASDEFCRIFGFPPEKELHSRMLEDLVLEEDQTLRSSDATRQDGSAPMDVEYRIRRADDGRLRWISRRAEFGRDADGSIRTMFGTTQDITDKKIAILRQEALLRLGNDVRSATSAEGIVSIACRIAMETLGASRAGYAAIDRRAGVLNISGECISSDVPAMHGSYDIADFTASLAQLERGEVIILNDASGDPLVVDDLGNYQTISVAAQISVPQMRKDALVGAFFVHQTSPRVWTAGEVDFMRRVADRVYAALDAARAEAEQAVLNHELSHRLKNSLSMVQAIASQTLRGSTDKTDLRDFLRRVQILSAAHDVLLQRNWEAGSIAETIRSTLASVTDTDRMTIAGPDIDLGPKSTLTLAMLLHELATNAVKYGSLSTEVGSVAVHWSLDEVSAGDADLRIVWQETGGPPVVPPSRKGFGSRLIGLGLTGTGGVQVSYETSGLIVEIRAPLSEVLQS